MEKGRGVTLGALFAAALLFRTGLPAPSQDTNALQTEHVAGETVSATEKMEGPWIASCSYWAPARLASTSKSGPPKISGTIGAEKVDLAIPKVHAGGDPGAGCDPKDAWGIPDNPAVNITALIAFAPDPVHTHLALAFDRTVDSILQAASDHGYVSSHYWLPWRSRSSGAKPGEMAGELESGHDAEKEREPGLIVLRHVPDESGPYGPAQSFYQTIYLFVVGETPTEGADGFQLQNALAYEASLKLKLNNRFQAGADGRLAMIGPFFSASAASIRAALKMASQNLPPGEVEISGATTPRLPVEQLTVDAVTSDSPNRIIYRSFASDSKWSAQAFFESLGNAARRVTELIEDDTVFGNSAVFNATDEMQNKGATVIKFPREISLLRNAQADQAHASPPAFSPYLRLSIKDGSAHDSVPVFSHENTPVSQEAQLMMIARHVNRYRSQFITLVASNPLDQIFLAQFLHRACPESTLVFFSSDLLTVREIDDAPFVGSVTITPYPMIGLGRLSTAPIRTYPSSASYAYYNATAYTLWRNRLAGALEPQGYTSPLATRTKQPPLWATVIGSDGYYPLAVLSACSSQIPGILPGIGPGGAGPQSCEGGPSAFHSYTQIFPSRLWDLLCAAVIVLCLAHAWMLYAADYWSPLTRDLAVEDNDHAWRRSVYLNVSTAALMAMASAVSIPVAVLATQVGGSTWGNVTAAMAAGAGLLAGFATWSRTQFHIGPRTRKYEWSRSHRAGPEFYRWADRNIYLAINLITLGALAAFLGGWVWACCAGSGSGRPPFLAGLSFCYRCINPGSGVSPLLPAFLLLGAWYLWGVMQTRRLRFSSNAKPQLPEMLGNDGDRFFVSEGMLARCDSPRDSCLYENITCFFITRKLLHRYQTLRAMKLAPHDDEKALAAAIRASWPRRLRTDATLVLLFMAGMGLALAGTRGMDHFIWAASLPAPFEAIFAAMFFPLMMVSVTGWVRMIVIWASLKRSLLDRLEALPIRFAFNRIVGIDWMSMLRQSGLQEQWRDLARSLESVRQMLHEAELRGSPGLHQLRKEREGIEGEIAELRNRVANPRKKEPGAESEFDIMRRVEFRLGRFAQALLSAILVPYWKEERTGLVEGERKADLPPQQIIAAEEFLAIRYISLIRAVLTNLRYLMIFVSISFALAILAWHSYPFQPRQTVDWIFTILLAILGIGVIAVFTDMHRNPILSRVTDAGDSGLGWEFYGRLISLGALPTITWLAYQFPAIGNGIAKFIQPAEPVFK